MKKVLKICLLLWILSGILIAQKAWSAPVTSRDRAELKMERRLDRLKRHRRENETVISDFRTEFDKLVKRLENSMRVLLASFDKMIEDTEADMCSVFGKEKYCGMPIEPELELQFLPAALWDVSKYYTPVPGQKKYFWIFKDSQRSCEKMRWVGYNSRAKGEYAADHCMNCSGNCFKPADTSVDLRMETPFRVGACPPEYPLGTRFNIEGFGVMKCVDRGGAIKGKRLDLWVGIGDEGVDNYVSSPSSGLRKVTIVK